MNKVIETLTLTLVINVVLASQQKTAAKVSNASLKTMAANRIEDGLMCDDIFKGKNKTVSWLFVLVDWPLFITSIGLFCFAFQGSGPSTKRVIKYELIIFLFAFLNVGFLVALFVPKQSFLGIQDVIANGFIGGVTSALLLYVNAFVYGRLKTDSVPWKTFVRHLLMIQSIVAGFVFGGIAYWKGNDLNPHEALNYLWATLIVDIFIAVSSYLLFIANWAKTEGGRTHREDSEKSVSASASTDLEKSATNSSHPKQSAISQHSTQQSTNNKTVAKQQEESRTTKDAPTTSLTKEPSEDSTFLELLNKTFQGVKRTSREQREDMLGKRNQKQVTEEAKKGRLQSVEVARKLSKEAKDTKLEAKDNKEPKILRKSPSDLSTGTIFFKEQVSKGKVEGKEITSYSMYGPRMFKE